ncbi:glycosyl hydrolase family 28-related protein [Sphingomonas sp. Leaf21]|uniref:glycosyl hydrolase family 28-related protein n=1 Tax=Sphingomonas sp. Leaf21 TaxID=2876550 RepID=UPI001E357F81|nr:glycosyl hydrolase family 28-related protein [Sphingomonas sp. Leaf21]
MSRPRPRRLRPALLALLAGISAYPALAADRTSVFAVAPADPRAVTVHARGDGRTDDGAMIQQAIDSVAGQGGGGIVFLPSGRYRLARTLYMRPGVRLFGVGRTRPVFVLAPNTPGFQTGVGTMVFFTGTLPPDAARPAPRVPVPPPTSVPFDPTIADANSGTFYSAMANVDFEIGKGNPAATAVRFHTAQHSYLAHIDFRLGDALAGIYQVGNLGQDLHFHGGRYGILTEKPSPAWSYTLIDSSFDGQRDAAIREHEAGLTLINTVIRNVPVGIEIDRGYGDWLWGKDVRFERVRRAGVVIGNEGNAYTQIGFEGATGVDTPVFAHFRDSGRDVAAPGRRYRMQRFGYGMTVPSLGQTGRYETKAEFGPFTTPRTVRQAVRALPPVTEWRSVRDLGVKGDDSTDDTAALQQAIDSHRVLYFPAGFYRVSDTLRLRPDSVLIGLHPSLTQIVLTDDSPGFRGIGSARGLIESARGGDAIVTGLGLATGGRNPRASALLWRAGADSLVDDVKFQGGHGTFRADGSRFDPYNADHTGDPDPAQRWDGQYPSLWVTDGGGGTFNGLWTPDTYASAGMKVSDTETPGHVYQLSAEHHRRAEIVVDNVAHWEFLAPQTEEEAGESRDAVAFEVRNARDILFANLHAYRVTRSLQPARAAIALYGVNDIRFRNVHVNAESGFSTCQADGCGTYLRASKYPYENAVRDMTRGVEVREREFATLDVTPEPLPAPAPAMAPVRRLADGFYSLGGGAIDASGKLYFVDRYFQRIHGWSEQEGLSIVSDAPLDPVNLAVDGSGRLMVLSSAGAEASVYSIDPRAPATVTPILPTASVSPNTRIVMPGSLWDNGEFRDQYDPATDRFTTLAEMFARDIATPKAGSYVAPDGSIALPAFRVWQQGPADHRGWRFSDTLDTYGLVTAKPGTRIAIANGSEDRTYTGLLGAGGAITDLKPFADRGGESVATGPDGRVYVANGQVFVYAPDGTQQGRIDVPERPLQLLFGGADGRTLFILSHHALYAARP